jgi:RND family efflux transporter MFP subunit
MVARYRNWVGLALIFGIVAAGTAYYVMQPAAPAAKGPDAKVTALTVTVVPVQQGMIPRSLVVTGSLAARDELPIGTETIGLALSEVLVEVGDHVTKGQLLARFNDRLLRATVQQMQASLNEARANASEAEANAHRADQLVKNGWMSGKDFDNRKASALTTAARVGVAEANLALAEAQLRQAEVRAPADGTITQRSAHLGAVMSAGGAELFRMIRDDRVELVAELPETDLLPVKQGQPVTLSVEGSAEVQGEVRFVEPSVDQKTRVGRVRIDVAKSPDLRPGMFVTGRILLGQTNGLTVPEKAVVYQDSKPRLYVIGADNTAELRSVQLGPRDNGQIAVLSGVKSGEHVALRGAGYLKNGEAVTIVDDSQALPSTSEASNPTHSRF